MISAGAPYRLASIPPAARLLAVQAAVPNGRTAREEGSAAADLLVLPEEIMVLVILLV